MPYASVFPLVTARRWRGHSPTRCRSASARSSACRSAAHARAASSPSSWLRRRKESRRGRSTPSSARSRRHSSSSRSGLPTTTARPLRGRSHWSRPSRRSGARNRRRRRSDKRSGARRSRRELSEGQRAAVARIVDGGARERPALRRYRLRQDRGLPAGVCRDARARPGRDHPRSGDRARAADGRPSPRALRRAGRDPALRADRGRAARRA